MNDMAAESVESISVAVQPLAGHQLYRASDLSNLAFSTTAELQPIDGLVGQARALEAVQFGTKVEKAGFNLFVVGPNGARMHDAVKAMLIDEARQKPVPSGLAPFLQEMWHTNAPRPDRTIR